MDKQDQAYDSRCKAFDTIEAPHRKKLRFQVSIGDNGEGFDLMTPYDERDGAFNDFSDCLIVEDRRL